MMLPTISVDEWLRELERVSTRNDDGYTSSELCETMGCSRPVVQRLLKTGIREGKITIGYRHVVQDWDGRPRTYTVYCPISTDDAA